MGLLNELFGTKNNYCVPINDYQKTIDKLFKSLNAPSLNAVYEKIQVFCDKCGVQFSRTALDMLYLMGPGGIFSGGNTIVMGGTKEGGDLRSGECPHCGHSHFKIVLANK
jgi:hypothetical protein